MSLGDDKWDGRAELGSEVGPVGQTCVRLEEGACRCRGAQSSFTGQTDVHWRLRLIVLLVRVMRVERAVNGRVSVGRSRGR